MATRSACGHFADSFLTDTVVSFFQSDSCLTGTRQAGLCHSVPASSVPCPSASVAATLVGVQFVCFLWPDQALRTLRF